MANTRTYFRSFAGGEISAEMYGRLDDSHYQTGAALLRNFVALPQGPAENRPGTKYIRPTKSNGKARLIPFTYSTTQTMVIELGIGYLRFHTQGATLTPGSPAAYNGATSYVIGDLVSSGGVNYYCIAATTGNAPPNATYWYAMPSGIYEIPSPYAEADLFDIHYVQSADVLTLVHPNHAPRELRRYGATNWQLSTINFGAQVNAPTGVSVTASYGQSSKIANISNAATAVFTLPSVYPIAYGDTVYISGCTGTGGFTLADGFYTCTGVGSPAKTFNFANYNTNVEIGSLPGTYTANSGTIQTSIKAYDIDNYYVVTAVNSEKGIESGASSSVHVINNLYVSGAYNTISWSAVSGATRYNVYKRQSGLYGYIGQTDGTSFTDNNIAPDMGTTPPIYDSVFASSGNYPSAVSYFEQRRIFAGTTNDPQYIWMTRSGTESDMSYSIPVKDNDRVAFRIASREANTIRHVIPLTQLLLLTSGGEWRVSPVNSDVLTPTTFSVRPQSYVGANNVQPCIVNNVVVYPSSRGGHVRELGYSWQAQGFLTGDLSIRAAHLFDGLNIVDMCMCKAPRQILWFVSDNGKLLGLTYIPEEQVGAWHQHDTDGAFESCTAVSENANDIVYVIVRRTINGSTVRYVECMASRQIEDLEHCVFVDSSLSYDGTNTSAVTMTLTGGTTWAKGETLTIQRSSGTFAVGDVGKVVVMTDSGGVIYRCTITAATGIATASVLVDRAIPVAFRNTATTTWSLASKTYSGLSHLEGKTVSILADGAVVPQQTVTSGAVTIPLAASVVTIGLPYDSDLKTLPMVLNTDGFGQGRMKNVNKGWLRVFQSSGIFIGPDADHLVEAKQRTTEPYGSPPSMKSDEILIVMTPAWQASGQVYVRQSDPLPLTIVGLTTEVSIGG